MRCSEQINEIAAALAKAQGIMKNPEKNRTAKIPTKAGGQYSYDYADLPSTFDTVRAALAQHDLSHTFLTTVMEGGGVRCECVLLHSSGQFLSAELMLPQSADIKGLAANVTYLRRYLFSALVGVAGEDDLDSEPEAPDASYGHRKPLEPRGPGIQPKPQAPPAGTTTSAPPRDWGSSYKHPSEAQLARLFAIANSSHWTKEQVAAYLKEAFDLDSTRNLTMQQYDSMCEAMPRQDFEAAMYVLTSERQHAAGQP
jgi:hypothetical protein